MKFLISYVPAMKRLQASFKGKRGVVSQLYFPEKDAGMILVITMLILVVLTIIGISATSTTKIELQIAGNDRIHKEGFYRADGGTEVGIQAVEENVGCPVGFTGSTLSGPKDPSVFWTVQGVQFADDRFAFSETIADLPWDPTVGGGSAGDVITIDDVPSDGARNVRIPEDISSPSDSDPHSNLAIYGVTRLSAGSAIQMAAGYEGKGKSAGGAGAHIAYNVHSQQLGISNSDTRLRSEWKHLVGQEGECNY